MSFIVGGPRKREGERDDEGYRTYTISFLVKCVAADGPTVAMNTPGLPLPGSSWAFGNDLDVWAYCKLGVKVRAKAGRENDPAYYYELEYTFSSKPTGKACKDQQIDDPLLQPMKISGGTNKHKEEATYDREGAAITNSAWEPIRGPHNEWDANLNTVKIEQNVANLQLGLCTFMRDRVNQFPLWGLAKRSVKLSNFTWEKKFYGQCTAYYTRTFEFDLDENTFDRDVLDEGSKVLNGKWDKITKKWTLLPVGTVVTGTGTVAMTPNPNPKNPSHFIRYKDIHDENTRTLLSGGVPWVPPDMVAGCAQCPDGMPERLQVFGLPGDIFLKWDGGCTWGPVDANDPNVPTLAYVPSFTNAGFADWVFTYGPIAGTTGTGTTATVSRWVQVGTNWKCTEANVMDKWDGPNPATSITIAPEGPTSIHIEKYDEADFFLLGIPAIL